MGPADDARVVVWGSMGLIDDARVIVVHGAVCVLPTTPV